MSQSVLVIDDDESTCALLAESLEARFDVAWTTEPERAEGMLSARAFDVVLTDVRMTRVDGIELCARLVKMFPGLPVVVMTAFGSIDTAVSAMRAGARDFLTKPFDLDVFMLTLERAIAHASLHRDLTQSKAGENAPTRYGQLVGASHAMRAVYEMVGRAAPSDASVLISGESGTGKEVLARTITQKSARAEGPFVAVNCAALPEPLLESELFGHTKGAFTDARTAREGLLAQAAGGTLFLDEVGDLPLALQPKLLRVLQERSIRPVGSDKEVPVDVRLICATNRDLETAIAERRFRADLFYRINVIHIALPRLSARGDDVLLLAQHFLTRFGSDRDEPLGLSPEAERLLQAYPWPGNVRELANCIERAMVLARGRTVAAEDLPEKIREYRSNPMLVAAQEPLELVALEEIERRYILRVLEAVHGNKSRAAQVLGLDRKTLYRRLERYGSASEEHSNGASANGASANGASANGASDH
jgi:two-component system, NtrC family, response regulator AtoC